MIGSLILIWLSVLFLLVVSTLGHKFKGIRWYSCSVCKIGLPIIITLAVAITIFDIYTLAR